MGLTRYKASNHPQQIHERGVVPDIDDRATPVEWFAELHARFEFTVDVAATAENTKLPRFYDLQADGLRQSWANERVWCNPPFSSIGAWVRKTWEEHQAQLAVLLIPANRTEQEWWHDYIEPYRDRPGSVLTTEFIKGRRRFTKPGEAAVEPNNRPPFGVCLLVWQWRIAPPALFLGTASLFDAVASADE